MSTDLLLQHAGAAREAVRTLNHLTLGKAMPAPLAYDLLAELHTLGYGLAQLATQVATGLTRSLTEYDVADSRDPSVSVAMATDALVLAERHAHRMAGLFSTAQVEIRSQYVNTTENGDNR